VYEPLFSENRKETEKSLNNKESVRLKHLQNNFNISFSIQDYSLNERVEYAYMLKGLENSWYTVKDPNNVTFRNLPPGKYEFMIKTRIRNQEWSDEISSIEIIIAPPLWLSWWAKLLYVISGVGLLFTGLWAYKRKLNLEYLYESEKKSHEQEQELNDERLRFYTNITHELRTPLTLILGPLEDLVKSNTLSSKDHHRISVIHQSAVRLLNLINQILDFRKTETQNKRLCVTKGNLTSAVYETGLKYKELNNKPEIQILIEVEEENMVLFFDKEVITMILDNLISNALKYTEKGYIRIRAEWVTENGIRYAQLSVEDTGYGIGQDALAHIFERYYQESGEHQASGTGIGLALVKNLVKLHEGDIQVKSLPEIGTTFYLRLPAGNTYPQALHGEDIHTDKQDGKEEEPIEKQEVADKDKNARPIILVVEDNADIRDYIADSFTDLYEIKTAANGKEGLQIATDCIPDIIVSDIMMPVMNGVVMCQKLKADIRTSHIPVILLTAKDSITDKEEGYQAGADSYLTKPFSAGLLQSRISNLLTQRRLLSERFAIRPDKPKKQSMEEKRAIITESMNKLDKEFLDKITNTITEGLAAAENIDITVLSNVMCMSSSTLYRKVKALTGMSTNEYIRKIKMQLAEKYLLEGKYSISEIAFKVGINSNVYFRQCFKEEFGMSASDYLKQLTGKSIDEKVDE
ncbi:hybrid sensor histidine kinase/response regulator transcription factor, partial [Phocaeicola plebeius]|uniref:hybrid sensor histidine kinase/response regulator transcription factor n=1 Tax=Phocaeicola plebeius TaxID=310297 RepID=UPI004026C0CE